MERETLEREMAELRQRHRELDRQLKRLEGHLSLSPSEQLERNRLKKEKLRAKDRLSFLLSLVGLPASLAGDPHSH